MSEFFVNLVNLGSNLVNYGASRAQHLHTLARLRLEKVASVLPADFPTWEKCW